MKFVSREMELRLLYAFFARRSFTDAAKALAAEHDASLISLAQIESDMRRWLQTASN